MLAQRARNSLPPLSMPSQNSRLDLKRGSLSLSFGELTLLLPVTSIDRYWNTTGSVRVLDSKASALHEADLRKVICRSRSRMRDRIPCRFFCSRNGPLPTKFGGSPSLFLISDHDRTTSPRSLERKRQIHASKSA
jgi:hypothetical protein